MNILIVKTSAIGDVIHTLPALNALRRKYPDARIDWLVEEAAADLVIGHAALDTVLVSRRKAWIRDLKHGRVVAAWRGFADFVKRLRGTEYDLLIDFQGLLKSGIFVGLARATRKVGFGKGMEHAEGSYLFLNEPVPPVNMDQHAAIRELLLLKAIGVDSEDVVFDLPVGEEQRERVGRLLAEAGIDPAKPLVAINPMTTWETKHWRNERFARVADLLLAKGVAVVFSGGPQDVLGIEGILAAMTGKAASLAGKTTLKELAALYERVGVLVTTDTGPMHLAAAAGTPVVALFGPTAPWRTGPFGSLHRILRADIACSPCLKRHCERTHECMEQITVDQVVRAAQAVLASRS
ncbi:MAG: lipopolysaccharide heptosyltransferase I [Desulfobulbaceae bacterium]|nr:lipopolysaccharide heptosyltransferase I [Desulfobulbaceae bacterium]HIJ91453.1 lipopolysaccharide heptosyltransferase I [Deltaproteobacteria bacterium]